MTVNPVIDFEWRRWEPVVSPFITFETLNDFEGVAGDFAYSEERFQVILYDAPTSGDLMFLRWQGAIPVNPDGSSRGPVTYVLNDLPHVYTETGHFGEWLERAGTVEGVDLEAGDGPGVYMPTLVSLIRSGNLRIEARRAADALTADRSERGLRVTHWGITYPAGVLYPDSYDLAEDPTIPATIVGSSPFDANPATYVEVWGVVGEPSSSPVADAIVAHFHLSSL